jgi:hypothetical protein
MTVSEFFEAAQPLSGAGSERDAKKGGGFKGSLNSKLLACMR